MPSELTQPTIVADDEGIHFLHDQRDIVLVWGEIAQIEGLRVVNTDGHEMIEVSVIVFSDVDFRFYSAEAGYEQAVSEMEKHLVGFKRDALGSVRTFEEEGDTIPVVWKRDQSVQPFELRPPEDDAHEPTSEERVQMQVAHLASVATCEKILGRQLTTSESACVQTLFKNGRIDGSINPPLYHLLVERKSSVN